MASRISRSVALLAEANQEIGERFVDMAISLRVADVESGAAGKPRWKPGTDEELIMVGGRWDRLEKRWCGPARRFAILRVHRGQEAAARWIADWIRRGATGDWEGVKRAWSALLIGARRSGKSHLAMLLTALFAVMSARAIIWAVSPTLETTAELDKALIDLLPSAWYSRIEARTGKALTFLMANGTTIVLRSSNKASRLKQGRADLVVLNEGQLQTRAAYTQVRGAIADTGGLVVITANPPDQPAGRWVEEHFNGIRADEIDGVAFELDPRKNPFVDFAALASMAGEVDEKTFARDVLGLFAPIGDVVMHAWSDRESWRDPPPNLVDVTAEVTARLLGRAAGYVVGADFQKTPHMAAVVYKLFRDPAHPAEVIAWVVDEVIVANADENDLIDALEGLGRWTPAGRLDDDTYRGWALPTDAAPVHCAVVADASGWWQDGAHTKGRTSDQAFRARRWTWLYKPQPDSDKNPDVEERVKSGNARLKAAAGARRMFVARHCRQVAEALRLWEMRHGKANRASQYAHVCDAVTYPIYRLFGRPKVATQPATYTGVRRFTRANDFRGV